MSLPPRRVTPILGSAFAAAALRTIVLAANDRFALLAGAAAGSVCLTRARYAAGAAIVLLCVVATITIINASYSAPPAPIDHRQATKHPGPLHRPRANAERAR